MKLGQLLFLGAIPPGSGLMHHEDKNICEDNVWIIWMSHGCDITFQKAASGMWARSIVPFYGITQTYKYLSVSILPNICQFQSLQVQDDSGLRHSAPIVKVSGTRLLIAEESRIVYPHFSFCRLRFISTLSMLSEVRISRHRFNTVSILTLQEKKVG
jgi:hypothetical protein